MRLFVFLGSIVLVASCSGGPSDPPSEVAAAPAPVPTETAPAVARTGQVNTADGATVVYESFGDGTEAVIFVHCWACHRGFWKRQIEPLQAAGYRVVTLDLPGHGEAEAGARTSWSLPGLAEDVAAVARDLGIERMILVGHSMGGPVSLEVAARHPAAVSGIVCVDTLHDVEFEWPEGMTERLTSMLEADYRAGLAGFIPSMFKADADPGLVAWVVEQGAASDPAATIPLMRAFGDWNAREALAAVSVPVRCINAAVQNGQGLATAIDTNRAYADFNAVLMDGVGHYPQIEQPDAFNRLLLDLLQGL